MLAILLSGIAMAASLPALVLGGECLLALLPLRKDRRAERGQRPALAVIVPAHNEQAGIHETLESLLSQLGPDDRLIVVADNCEDETADVARRLGATVLERVDRDHRGKGYAIRFALKDLAAKPPQVVAVIDADCIPQPGCLERIARAAFASGHPIQSAYVMLPPVGASPGTLISAFAVVVKNYIRPRGLQRLRMPCLITGSGVAYPWEALEQVPHPKSHIVEDMHYSVDLALAGMAPLPCMEAVVESRLPAAKAAARTQRTRWEHGHLSVMLSQGPRLLTGAWRQQSLCLLVLFLELMVPPLSLLLFLLAMVGGMLLVTCWWATAWAPLALFSVGMGTTAIGLTTAWWRFGRRALPVRMLAKVPQYVLGKLSIYAKFLTAPEQSWVRTARDPNLLNAGHDRMSGKKHHAGETQTGLHTAPHFDPHIDVAANPAAKSAPTQESTQAD